MLNAPIRVKHLLWAGVAYLALQLLYDHFVLWGLIDMLHQMAGA